jgi:metabolite-proton symporter
MSEISPPISAPSAATIRRVAIASMIGTSIEWYDFYIFGIAAALAIGPQFFPHYSHSAATFAAFATFGVGFVAKPLGAVAFGHYGDRVGRKAALVVSLLMMGAGTALVGCLPNYQTIGLWAPVLLVVLRILQGIGIGGEWGGAALMAAEYAPKERRGFFVSWPQFGSPVGLLLATGAFLVARKFMSADQFAQWGWRLPFLASAVLIVIGLIIRLQLEETPQFRKLQASNSRARVPIVEVIKHWPGRTLLVGGAFMFNTTAFFIITTFLLSYATGTVHMSSSIALWAQLVGGVTLAIGVPIAALVSDRFGRKRTILTLYLAWLLWIWPMFHIVDTGSTTAFIFVVGIGTILTSAYGPIGAFLLEQFDTRVRYTGASVGMTLGSVVGGGIGPLIALKMQNAYGSTGIAIYVVCFACVSACCVALLRDRAGEDIEAEQQYGHHAEVTQSQRGSACLSDG